MTSKEGSHDMTRSRHARSLAAAASAAVLVLAVAGCDKPSGQPAGGQPLPKEAFQAEITAQNPPTASKVNASFVFPVKVKNLSPTAWPATGDPEGKGKVDLCYHWINKQGAIVVFDGLRTILPQDLEAGKELTLQARVAAPDKPGDYVLELDLVQERLAWFKDKGSKTLKLDVKVE
jgi:hypothetical protein